MTKSIEGKRNSWRRKLVTIAVASCFAAEGAYANPLGPTVVNGQVSFNSSGNLLQITNTPGAIINWRGFSISASEVTRFVQQSASSSVMNRVTGVDPSVILGSLQSNGRVFLINPNGISFGAGSQVNTAGLVASTLGLADADFLAGRYRFTEVPGAGGIINQGVITTPSGGSIYLVAPSVNNSGVVRSDNGEIVLAAGNSVELVNPQSPDLRVLITAPDNQAVNVGQIIAQNGSIGIYGGLIRQGGVVNANTAVMGPNGKIVFKATKDVTLDAGSITTTSGTTNGAGGGGIAIESQTITSAGVVQANAADNATAGNVSMVARNDLLLDATSRVEAKGANVNSAGGSVYFYAGGDALARNGQVIDFSGGTHSGDGGSGEFSAGKTGAFAGTVMGNAAPGFRKGSFLIDPLTASLGAGTIAANTTIQAEDNITIDGNATINSGITLTLLADHETTTPGNWDVASNGSTVGVGSITRSGAFTITGTDNTSNLIMYAGGGGIGTNGTQIQTAMNGGNITVFTDNPAQVGSADTFISNTGIVNIAGVTAGGANNFSLTSTGAIAQTGAIVVGGASNFSAGANAITLGNTGNDFTGAVSLSNSAANNVLVTDTNALVLGTVTIGSGTNAFTAGTTLARSAALTVGASPTITVGGNAANAGLSSYFVSGAASSVQISAAGANLDLTTSTTGALPTLTVSGALTVNAGANVTQTGVLSVAGTTTVNGGAHAITLDTQSNNLQGRIDLNNTGANNVALDNSGSAATQFGNVAVGSGTLTVTSASPITQVTGTTITQAAGAGAASFTAGANAITLGNPGNDFTGAISLSNSAASDVLVTDTNALVLGTVTIGSGTNAFAAGTTLARSAALTVGASPTITVGGNAANAGLSGYFVSGAASSVQISAAGANLDLTTSTTGALPTLTVSGALTVNAGADVTQTGVLSVAGTTTVNGGAHAITLDTQSNNLQGRIDLNNTGANNVALDNSGSAATQFGNVAVGSGTLTVTSASPITQVTGTTITQAAGAGAASFTAGANAITLGNTGNDFTGAVVLNSSGADVSVSDTNALTLASPTLGINTGLAAIAGTTLTLPAADINTGTGNINLRSNGGTLTTAGNLATTSGTITLIGSGGISIGHNVTTTLAGGTLTLSSTNNTIAQTAAAISIADTTTVNAGGGAITLTRPNDFTGAVSLNNSGANNVQVTDANAIVLGTSSVGTGTLTVNAVGITQTGAITQAAAAGAANLNGGAAAITLTQANDFTGAVSLNNSGANDVQVTDANSILLGASAVGGNLVVTTNGAITQAGGALTVTGGATFDTSANATIGTVAITAQNPVGALTINASNVAGDITLDAGARNITFSGTTNVGGDVILPGSGTITGGSNVQAAGANEASSGGSTITASSKTTDFTLKQNLLNKATGPNVTIELSPGSSFTAGNYQAASAINLGLANVIGGPLTINTGNPSLTAGGAKNFNLVEGGNLNFQGYNITVHALAGVNFAGTNTLNSNNGSMVTLTSANTNLGAITFANTYTTSLDVDALTFAGASTVNGVLSLTANKMMLTGGTIAAGSNAVNLTSSAAGNTISLGSTTDAALNTLELSSSELNSIATSGVLTVGDVAHTGPINVTATINPTNPASLTLLNKTGGIAIGADVTASNNLTLTANAGGAAAGAITHTAGALAATAGNLTLNAAMGIGASGAGNEIVIGTPGGNLSAVNTTSGGIFLAPTGNITLGGASAVIDEQVSGGTISVVAGGNITIGGNLSVSGGGASTIILDATGTITEASAGAGTVTGATVSLGNAGTTTSIGSIAAPVLTSSTGTLTLKSSGAGSAGDITVSEANALNTTRVALTTAGTGQTVTINDTNAGGITAGGAIGVAANNITLNATIGKITEGAGTVTGNNVALDSATGVGTSTVARVATAATTLAARARTSGGVFVSELDGVTLNTIGAVGDSTIGGATYDVTAAGTLSIAGTVSAAGGGAINLTATGGSGSIAETGSGLISTTGTLTTNSVTGTNLGGAGANAVGTFNATNTTSGDVVLTGNASNPLAISGISETGGNVTVSNTGPVSITGAINAAGGGAINLTALGATGSIGETGTGVITTSGTLTTSSVVGQTLNAATNDVGTLAATNSASGTISYIDANAVSVSGSNTGGGAFNVTAGGANSLLTVNGSNIASNSGAVTLAADNMTLAGTINSGAGLVTLKPNTAATVINVGGAGADAPALFVIDNSELGQVTSTGGLTIGVGSNTGGLVAVSSINPANVTAGTFSLTTGGAITQTTGSIATSSAANLALNAVAGIGVIAGPAPISIGVVSGSVSAANTSSGDLYLNFTDAGTINVGGASGISQYPGGNLQLDSAGPMQVVGNLLAGTGSVTLNPTGALTRTAGTITADTIGLGSNNNATAIGATGAGEVFVRSSGGVASPTVTAKATTGGIFLNQTSGDLHTASYKLIPTSANQTIELATTAGNIVVDHVYPTDWNAVTQSDNISLLSSGNINETTLISTAGTLTTNSATGQTLNGANTVGTFNATNTASGSVALTNTANPLTITGISNTGGGSDTVINTGGIAVTGAISTTAGGAVNLTASGVGSSIMESGGGRVNTTGTLTTSSWEGQALSGANTVGIFNATNTTSGDIALINTANPLGIAGIASTVSGSTISVSNTGAMSITGTITVPGGGAVNLTATGGSGSITESGGGLVNTAGTLSTNSVAGQTLNGANTVGLFNATNTASGNIQLTNTAAPLTVTGISNTGGGSDAVNNTGGLSITGAISTTGGGAVDLTVSGAGGSIAESGGGQVNTSGTLTTSSWEGQSLNGANTAGTFNAMNTTTGNVALTNTAAPLTITGISSTVAASTITVSNTGAMNITGSISVSGGGAVNLTASSAIGQTAGGIVTGGLLTTSSATGTDLSTATNAVTSFNASNSGAGTVNLHDSTATLTVTGITDTTAGGPVTVNNSGGALSLTGAVNAGANAVNLTASSTIGQTAGGIITGGLLTTSSATGTDLSTATNAVTSFNASNSGAGTVNLHDSTATLTVTGITDTTAGGPVTVNNSGGALSLTGAVNAGANAVNLTASSTIGQTAGGIITGGLLTTSSATGTDLSTATNAVTSFNASNSGAGTVNLHDSTATLTVTGITDTTAGGPVTVNNSGGALSLTGAVNAGANAVNLTASSTIGQTAGGIITGGLLTTSSATGTDLSTATNAVTSFNASNSGAGTVNLHDSTATLTVTGITDTTAGGPVTVNNSGGALSLTGAVNAGANAVNLTASSTIGQTAGGIITGGLLTTSSATGTDLSTATNAVTSFNASNSGAGTVNLHDSTATLTVTGITDTTAGGPVTVNNSGGALSLTGAVNAGANAVNLTASSTIGQTAGGIITGGLLTTSSATGTDLSTATNAVTSFNASNSGAGTVNLHDSTATLTVTGITDTTAGGPVTVNNSGGALSLTGAVNAGANAVNLTASSTIGQTAGGIITGGLLTTFSATGTDLSTATNAVTSFNATNTTSGNIALINTANPLTITGISNIGIGTETVTNAGAISITGTVTTGSGAVNLAATGPSGSITESGGGLVNTTGTLTTNTLTGQTLNGANTVGSFNATNNTSGAVSLTNTAGTLTITGISESGGGNVAVTNSGALTTSGTISTVANGVISLTSSGLETIGAPVTAGGTGTATLTALGITNNSTVTSAGGITVDAGTGILANNGTLTNTGGATATTINLTGDKMALAGTISAGAGAVNVTSTTPGYTINLGSAVDTTPATAELSNVELNTITTTGTLTVGSTPTVANHTGAITISAPLTFTNPSGPVVLLTSGGNINVNSTVNESANNLTLNTKGAGAIGGAILDSAGTGLLNISGAHNLNLVAGNGIGTITANPLQFPVHINLNNTATLQASNSSGGDVNITNPGSVTLATNFTNSGPGELRLTTGNGTIDTSTANVQANSGRIAFIANDGGSGGNITVGSGGITNNNGNVVLHAADTITINGTVSTNGGNVEIIAAGSTDPGFAPGFAGFSGTNPPLATEASDDTGQININATVNPGASGNIVLITSGNGTSGVPVTITESASGLLGIPGSVSGGELTAVTLRGTGGITNGASIILGSVNPPITINNTMQNVNLFSCPQNGCPDASGARTVPPFTQAPMIQDVSAATPFGGGSLQYTSSAATGTTINSVGTAADFTLFNNGNFTLTGLVLSANNLTIQTLGNTTISLSAGPVTNANIGNSLSIVTSGNIVYNSSGPGNTIGSAATPFNRHLTFVAGGNIDLNSPIYIGTTGSLAINAYQTGTIANGTALNNNTIPYAPSGTGTVTFAGNNEISVAGPFIVNAQNLMVKGGAIGSANQQLIGERLIATGTFTFNVVDSSVAGSGNVTVQAGAAVPGLGGSDSAAIITAPTIIIGSSTNRVNSLALTGGTSNVNGTSSQYSDAQICAGSISSGVCSGTGTLNVYIGNGGLTLTGNSATIGSGAASNVQATAIANLQGGSTILDVLGNVLLQGGSSNAQGGLAATSTDVGANATASIVSGGGFNPNIKGSLTMNGGLASAGTGNSHDVANALLKGGSSLYLTVANGITLQGGNATTTGSGSANSSCLGGGGVCATAVALISSEQADQKIFVTNGSLNISGGSASAGDSTTSANALAGVDPVNQSTLATTLTISASGGTILNGGTGLTGVQTPSGTAPGVASGAAILFSPGAIVIGGGLTLIGAQGSGLFQNIALSNSIVGLDGTVPPVTVNGGYFSSTLAGVDSAFVLSGAPPSNLDPLLSGLLYAIDQSKSARVAFTLADTGSEGKDKNYCK